MVSRMSTFNAFIKSSALSKISANCLRDSATAVFSTTFASATEAEEPSILNSNLLPVKAKGEVLFLSVVSFGNFGKT